MALPEKALGPHSGLHAICGRAAVDVTGDGLLRTILGSTSPSCAGSMGDRTEAERPSAPPCNSAGAASLVARMEVARVVLGAGVVADRLGSSSERPTPPCKLTGVAVARAGASARVEAETACTPPGPTAPLCVGRPAIDWDEPYSDTQMTGGVRLLSPRIVGIDGGTTKFVGALSAKSTTCLG